MIDFGIKINIFIIHLSGRRSHGNGNILTHADNSITNCGYWTFQPKIYNNNKFVNFILLLLQIKIVFNSFLSFWSVFAICVGSKGQNDNIG